MHRRQNNSIAFQATAVTLVCSVLSDVATPQSTPRTDLPGFHFLLRLEGGKTTYKLGEAIQVEFGCFSASAVTQNRPYRVG